MTKALAALLVLGGYLPSIFSSQIAFQTPFPLKEEEILQLRWEQRPSDRLFEILDARYDIWSGTRDSLDLRVPASDRAALAKLIEGEPLSMQTLHSNVTHLLHQSHISAVPPDIDDTHSAYHPLEAIEALLRLFAADHPKNAKLVAIGKSAEDRTIYGLRISRPASRKRYGKGGKNGKRRKDKVGLLIVGGQHAREWISTASALYMAHAILLQADHAPKKLRRLLDAFDLTFVPTLNPDGYEYSWREDRLWRKNRQRVADDCFGIDLNRNWGYHWSPDRFNNPCSDSYPGKEPFEALEVQVLRDYLHDAKHKFIGVLDLHSFGQMLMWPYGYSCSRTASSLEDLTEAAYGGVRAAAQVEGLTWEVGAVCEVSYTSSGQLVDYFYGKMKRKWAFSVNLRDLGVHGFLLPASQIRSAGEETLAMLLAIADFVRVKEKL